MVEYKLPKLGVAGSTPVARSINLLCFQVWPAPPFEVVDPLGGRFTSNCGLGVCYCYHPVKELM